MTVLWCCTDSGCRQQFEQTIVKVSFILIIKLGRTHTWPSCSVLCRSMIVPPPQPQAGLHSLWSSCSWAWAHLPLIHTSSGHSMITAQWRTTYKTTENMALLTFLWLILCSFGHRRPSHIRGFFDNSRWHSKHHYASCPRCAPMLKHDQPYCGEAHLFTPCKGQESVLCLSMVCGVHTGQTNWTWGSNVLGYGTDCLVWV